MSYLKLWAPLVCQLTICGARGLGLIWSSLGSHIGVSPCTESLQCDMLFLWELQPLWKVISKVRMQLLYSRKLVRKKPFYLWKFSLWNLGRGVCSKSKQSGKVSLWKLYIFSTNSQEFSPLKNFHYRCYPCCSWEAQFPLYFMYHWL